MFGKIVLLDGCPPGRILLYIGLISYDQQFLKNTGWTTDVFGYFSKFSIEKDGKKLTFSSRSRSLTSRL